MSSDLRRAISEYLAIRRSLGFALRDAEWLLAGFASYLEDRGTVRVTTGHAVAWATQPGGTHPHWWHQRLAVVRDFARYLASTGQAAEVPPRDLLPACHIRRAPYLYSGADITSLMAAARTLRPPLRAATYETLVGLLAVTGLRISEAIRLDRDDFDQAAALLAVRHAKHGSSARCRCTIRPLPRCRATGCCATGRSRAQPLRRSSCRSAAPGWTKAA
jgi:integrase/recombinase XerD